MSSVLIPLAAVGALATVLASMLVAAHRKLAVVQDPRIEAVADMLPSSNCGACGYAGCRAFAEALVEGSAEIAKCTVSSADGLVQISGFLGRAIGEVSRRVARLACAGGSNVARNRAHYSGLASCAAQARVGGGGKGCSWGCLGIGDCEVACGFGAIVMSEHGLPVVDAARCTACGDCVSACPKDLFSLESRDRRLWVACRSMASGSEALQDCEVACDGCGRCAKDAPMAVTMKNHLPVVNDSPKTHRREAIERCPTGAIVWLEDECTPTRGASARKIIRNEPRESART